MNLRWVALVLMPLTTHAAPAPLGSDTLVYTGSSDSASKPVASQSQSQNQSQPQAASPAIVPSSSKDEILVAPTDFQAPIEIAKPQPEQPETVLMKAARLEVLRVMEAKAAADASAEYEQLQRSGELADNSGLPPAPGGGSFSGSPIAPAAVVPAGGSFSASSVAPAPAAAAPPVPSYNNPAPQPMATTVATTTPSPPQPAPVSAPAPAPQPVANTPQPASVSSDSQSPQSQDSHVIQKGNSLIDSGGGWGN